MSEKDARGAQGAGGETAKASLGELQERIQACKKALAERDTRTKDPDIERASTLLKLAEFFFKSKSYTKAEDYTTNCEKAIAILPPKTKMKQIAIKPDDNLDGYHEKLCEIDEVLVSYRILGKEMHEVAEALAAARKAYDTKDEKELKKLLDSASKRIYKELKRELPKVLLSLEHLNFDKDSKAYNYLDEARVLFGLGNYILALGLAAQAYSTIMESASKPVDEQKTDGKGASGQEKPDAVDEKQSSEQTQAQALHGTSDDGGKGKERRQIKLSPIKQEEPRGDVVKIKLIDKWKDKKKDGKAEDKGEEQAEKGHEETGESDGKKQESNVPAVEHNTAEKQSQNSKEGGGGATDVVDAGVPDVPDERLAMLVKLEKRISALPIPRLSDSVSLAELCKQAKDLGLDLSEVEGLMVRTEGEACAKPNEQTGTIKKILKCAYCKGLIRFNTKYVECECGKVIHRECAKRRSRCPECQRTLTWDEHERDDPQKLAYEKLMIVLRPYHKLLARLTEGRTKLVEAKSLGFDIADKISELEHAVDKFVEKDYEGASDACEELISGIERDMERRTLAKLTEVAAELSTIESLDAEVKQAKEKLNNSKHHADEKKYAKAVELANSALEDARSSAAVKVGELMAEAREQIAHAEAFGEELEVEKNELAKAEYLEKQSRVSEALDTLQKLITEISPIVSKKAFEVLSACQARLLKAQDSGVDVSVADVSFVQAKQAYEKGDYRRAVGLSKQTEDDLANALAASKALEESKGRLTGLVSPTISQLEESERLGVPLPNAGKVVAELKKAIENGDEARAMEMKRKLDEMIETNVSETAKNAPEAVAQLIADAKTVGIDTSWSEGLYEKMKAASDSNALQTVLQHSKQIRTTIAEAFHKRALDLSQKLSEAVQDAERDGLDVGQYSKKAKEVKDLVGKKHYAVAAKDAFDALDAVRGKHHEVMEKVFIEAMQTIDVAKAISVDMSHEEKLLDNTKADYESGRTGPSKLLHVSKQALASAKEGMCKIFEARKKECIDEIENARSYGLDLASEDAKIEDASRKFASNPIESAKDSLDELSKCKYAAIQKVVSRLKERIDTVRAGLGKGEVHDEARRLLKSSEDALMTSDFDRAIELLKRAKATAEVGHDDAKQNVKEKDDDEREPPRTSKADKEDASREEKEERGKKAESGQDGKDMAAGKVEYKEPKKESTQVNEVNKDEPDLSPEKLSQKLALTEQAIKRHGDKGNDIEWALELIRFARLGLDMKEYKNANHFLNQIIEGLKDEDTRR